MNAIELARRMAQLGETQDALRAYAVALSGNLTAREQLEAAVFIMKNGGDYKIAYSTFVGLYNAGQYKSDIMPMMRTAFLEPNLKLLKSRYERNCKALSKYLFISRKDFIPFDELPLIFFPYDDHSGYVPYDSRTDSFRGFVNVKETVIHHYFFKDLEKPILASDVYSQYELEYLNDNVRKSEWIGRENHIYLHYTDWAEFCSYLTVLTLKQLLEDQKFIFLFGDELSDYPYDFKERYGVDYSQYPVKPIGIREVNKLIWHTQLSSDNGGDFFNEVFDYHPNLLCFTSVIFDTIMKVSGDLINQLRERKAKNELGSATIDFDTIGTVHFGNELCTLTNPTYKDVLVACYLSLNEQNDGLDLNSRIAPALFFQPHFYNLEYSVDIDENGNSVLTSDKLDEIMESPIFRDFKYIKTFTPMRRFTTAYAATLRYMVGTNRALEQRGARTGKWETISDVATSYAVNRSFMRDPDSRLYRDAVIVRFEDGKLNPKATFTKLAEFLDIPYTESMTYCSQMGKHDVETAAGNAIGFDPVTVYRTYDEFVDDADRCYIEFFLRDAYEFYGYDFHYYDGKPVDVERIKEWLVEFKKLDHYVEVTWRNALRETENEDGTQTSEEEAENLLTVVMYNLMMNRLRLSEKLLKGLNFLNKRNQPLSMIPLLQPDPELLDQPIYH
ncbi:MAG: hypothetical protein J5449_08150 [Oscillospiraceae bacterium]|nr:hypothetical protein [Oscillospiraceae bacterium]